MFSSRERLNAIFVDKTMNNTWISSLKLSAWVFFCPTTRVLICDFYFYIPIIIKSVLTDILM